ncbi:MAG: tetratricopeptide repeat protein [Cyanobacteria bacterium SZAS-4]|nr:tetratricopeptide repeat protein [Cyanobacteria bacterium SZAS-4]
MSSDGLQNEKQFGPEQILQLNKELRSSSITLFVPPSYDRSLLPIKARGLRNWWETDEKTRMHARFCLPLTMASGLGYYILSPATFVVEWDGVPTHDTTIEILDGASHTQIDNHSSFGSFTVQAGFIARTKNIGEFVYIKGVANQERPAFNVLEAMIESWWSPSTFGIVCVVNRAGKFKINKGEPLAQMFVVGSSHAEYGLSVLEGYPPFWDEWNERRRPEIYNGRNMDYLRGVLPDQTPVCPHLKSWSKSPDDQIDEDQATSLWRLGEHARTADNIDESVRHYTRALQIAEEKSELTSELLYQLFQVGHDLQQRAHFVQSARLLRKCVDLTEKYFPDGLHFTTDLLTNIAYSYRQAGDLEAAREILQQLLARQRGGGVDALSLARTLIDLGTLRDLEGDFENAQNCLDEAQEIFSANLPVTDVQFLYLKNVYACLLSHMNQFDRALTLYNEVVAAKLEIFGERSSEVAVTYNDLAFHYKLMKRFDQSEEYFSKYLSILVDKYGASHLDVAAVHENLGWLFREAALLQKAKVEMETALRIRKELLYPKDDRLRGTYLTLADICDELGDRSAADKLRKEAV